MTESPPPTSDAAARRYAAPALLVLPLAAALAWSGAPRMPAPTADSGPHADLLPGRIDPNTATAAELAALPQVGETVAARIVEFREAAAAERLRAGEPAQPVFRGGADLDAVPGIGPVTLEHIAPYLIFPKAP